MRSINEWRAKGKCADLTPDESDRFFFLDRGGSPKKTRALFCDTCPVKKECFEFAVLYDEDGIWGGATEKQRKIVAPLLKPRLKEEARLAGLPTERQPVPIAPQPVCSDPTEFQLPQEILDDIDLNTYLQTGS